MRLQDNTEHLPLHRSDNLQSLHHQKLKLVFFFPVIFKISFFCLFFTKKPLKGQEQSRSNQVVLLQVELEDGVLDSCKDETDVFCVCGTCEMGIDDFITVGI